MKEDVNMFFGMKRTFMNLKSFNFFLFGGNAILYPFLPLYLQSRGFDGVHIGFLMAAGPIIALLSNPFWGYWCDRLQNNKKILIFMLFGNLLLSLILFQMETFLTAYMIMLVFFFFQTALVPVTESLVLHAISKTNYPYGTVRLWGSVGFAVLAVLSGVIVEWLGIGNLGWIFSAFLLSTIFISFGLPKQGKPSRKFSTQGLSRIIVNRYYLMFLVLSLIIALPSQMNTMFLSLYINELGGSKVDIGWSFFLAAIGEVPIFLLLDRFFKRTPKAMIGFLTISCLLYSVRWALTAAAEFPFQVGLIQILHSVTFGVYLYMATQLCVYLIPKMYRTAGLALYSMCWMGVAGILAGTIGGAIFEYGGARLMYGISSLMSLVSMFGFMLLWKRVHGFKQVLEAENEEEKGIKEAL
jgi:PPP family 3-phenylpropionic acid transporter